MKMRRVNLILLFACTISGCSPSLFTGDKKNDQKDTGSSVQSRSECFGIDLSNNRLDVKSVRGITSCLNKNNSMKAFSDSVAALSDQELGDFVGVVNETVMADKQRLSDLNSSMALLSSQGSLDAVARDLSRMAANREFSRGFAKVLLQILSKPGQEGDLDPETLRALSILVREWKSGASTRESLASLLEFMIRTSELKSWREMGRGFSMPIPLGRPVLNHYSADVLEYFKAKIRAETPLGKLFFWGLADRSLLAGWDHFFSGHEENGVRLGLDHQVASFADMVRYLNLDHKDILKSMDELISILDTRIDCLDGTKAVPNGSMYIVNELIRWTPLDGPGIELPSLLTRHSLASSICAFPPESNEHIGVVLEIAAAGRPLVMASEFLKSLKQGDLAPISDEARSDLSILWKKYPPEERYRHLLMALLGDQSPVNSFTNMADVAGEISRPGRDVTPNLLYFINAEVGTSGLAEGEVNPQREPLSAAMKILMLPRAELDGKSVYDKLTNGILNVDADSFGEFIRGISKFADQEDEGTLLRDVHSAAMSGGVNPLSDIVLKLGEDAASHSRLLSALLRELANPRESMFELFGKMSEDKILTEFVSNFMRLLTGKAPASSAGGVANVAIAAMPAGVDRSTAVALVWRPIQPRLPTKDYDACARIDFNLDLSKVGGPGWAAKVEAIAMCANARGGLDGVSKFVNWLEVSKTPEGQPILDLLAGEAVRIVPKNDLAAPAIFDRIGDWLLSEDSVRDASVMQDGLALTIDNRSAPLAKTFELISTLDPNAIATLKKAAADVAIAIVDQGGHAQADFGPALVAVRQASKAPPALAAEPTVIPNEEKIRAELAEALLNSGIPKDQIMAKVDEKVADYLSSVKSGVRDRFAYADVAEFKRLLTPALTNLSRSDRPALETMLTFFERLNNDPYDAEWISGWFARMAGHVRMIPYWMPGRYPGKDAPDYILVNDLDLLELVAVNADFTLAGLHQPLGGIFENPNVNFVIKYFALLATAGDHLTEYVDTSMGELDHYYKMVSNPVLGVVVKKELKRRLYNLHHVLPLIREMNSREETAIVRSGTFTWRTVKRNDLGVIRDLFYAALIATPKVDWMTFDRSKNTLSVVVDIAQFGLFRTIGPMMWRKAPDGSTHSLSIAPYLRLLEKLSYVGEFENRKPNPNSQKLLDLVARKDFDTADADAFNARWRTIGDFVELIWNWSHSDANAVGESADAMFSVIDRIDRMQPDADVAHLFVRVMGDALGTPERLAFMKRHHGIHENLLNSKSGADAMYALLNLSDREFAPVASIAARALTGVGQDVSALADFLVKLDQKNDLSQFVSAWDQFGSDPDVQRYKVERLTPLLNRAYDWIAQNPNDPAAKRIQEVMGRTLQQGILVDILFGLSADPVLALDRLRGVTNSYTRDAFLDFLRAARLGIQDTYP